MRENKFVCDNENKYFGLHRAEIKSALLFTYYVSRVRTANVKQKIRVQENVM